MRRTVATSTGFEEMRVEALPLLQATAHEFQHTTGAKLIHFDCADENNAFAAIMPTVPTDETGAPHILEHCLFAGSARYPDAASRGALITSSSGAWTAWEYTWYFFSSPSHRDFLKRADIWCDALFAPLLEFETFQHQAHHLEFEDPDDPTTHLRYRGVIYNEQKGIIGFPIYVTWTEVCRALFPGHPYALEHGGTPRTVPTITHAQLKAFHERHYHPANAHFLSWGDVPIDELLAMMDEALTRVPQRPFTPIPFPPVDTLGAPVRRIGRLPIAEGEDPTRRTTVLMAWVTAPATDPYESLLHDLITDILMGSATAPLRNALASSRLGQAFADTYDKYGIRFVRHTTAAGLDGCRSDVAGDIETLAMRTLSDLVRDGIDPRVVDAALTRLEFKRRTLSTPHGDEGLPTSFFVTHINTPWLAGGDPLAGAKMDVLLARLEGEHEAGRPIEDRIRAWYLENPHRAAVIIEPDPGAAARLETEERRELDAIASRLSQDEKHEIVAATRRLRSYLQARSAPPPVPAEPRIVRAAALKTTSTTAAGVPVVAYPARTNGITYVDVFFDIGEVPDDLWDLLNVFCRAITRAGADGRTPTEVESLVGTVTGGLDAEVLVPVCGNGDAHLRLLRVGGRALERHQDGLIELVCSLLASASFEPPLLRAVIDGALSRAEQYVFVDAPGYLKRLAGSGVRTSWALRDRIDGFAQLALLRRLANRDDAGLRELCEQFEAIRSVIGRRGACEVFVAASGDDTIERLVPTLGSCLAMLPDGGSAVGPAEDLRIDDLIDHHARTFGQPTAFNCAVFATPTCVHAAGAALLVAGTLAGRWIDDAVSLKRTAYHASVDVTSDPGSLVCWSIRDPNIAGTHRAFEGAIDRLREGRIDAEELEMSRLEASIAWEGAEPPAVRARRDYVRARAGFGTTEQAVFREALLAVGTEDIASVARTHIGPAARATLTSAEMLERAASEGCAFDVVAEA